MEYIARQFTREGIKNWNDTTKWHPTTLQSMLENEKYKGDAILQKSYTVDFLTKKRVKNDGVVQKYYVEESHEAIIDPEVWECVQLEMKRRKEYMELHGTNSYSHNTETNPFASKIICGNCNKIFSRKGWKTGSDYRKVWQCSERYKVKGVLGCNNRHADEATLEKAFVMSWNAILENKAHFIEKWKTQSRGDNLLSAYRAERFIALVQDAEPIEAMETDFMLMTLDHIKVFESGKLLVTFMEGTEMELGG